ncbi:MAG: prephenate dehydratase, partial [Thermodesulfobacteriota bacterium]
EFDVRICGEQYEPVSYDLISCTGETEPVETIYCHPQAYSQCKMWIHRKYPDARIKEVSSTARAASMASEDERSAVVSGSQAAHIYNLQTVESSIEDYPGNITRFLVISRDIMDKTGRDKTSIMFSTSHTPGSLFKALEPLNEAGVNMLKLESRPARNHNWSYCFFMDIEGHTNDPDVKKTLDAMGNLCLSLTILGSYPAYKEELI